MKIAWRQAMGFLIVGGLSAFIDATVFWLLTLWGLAPPTASAISFLTAFGVNYTGNKRLVFRAAHSPGALWRYIALVVINLGLSAGGVALGVWFGLDPLLAKLVSMVVVAVVNFFAMRLWVFRSAEETVPPATEASEVQSPLSSD